MPLLNAVAGGGGNDGSASPSLTFRVTIPASAVWEETDNYFYVNVQCPGMKSEYDVVVDYVRTGDLETDNAVMEAFDAVVFDIKTFDDYIQVRNYSDSSVKVAIPLILKA